jgi:hypothetical protein
MGDEMDEQFMVRSGGGQAPYVVCSHSACSKKARNVGTEGNRPVLSSGDHVCCGHSKHANPHANRERENAKAAAATSRAGVSPSPWAGLFRAVLRSVANRR